MTHFTYRMPAEWEPHEATWLVWPKNKHTWPGAMLREVESIYLRIISTLLAGEKVQLLVDDRKAARRVLAGLTRRASTQRLRFHLVKTADAWIRDYGPIFVRTQEARGRRQEKAFVKWVFNAWGGKDKNLARDNSVVDRIAYLKPFRRFNPGIVLEGGSIDVNGRGALLTTEQCLLNSNRNLKFSRGQIESRLKKYLGVRKILWLKGGIEGDDTDGHVDDVARFVNPSTAVAAVEPDSSDKNHEVLKKNLEILKRSSGENGRKLEIVELPMPGRVGEGKGGPDRARLPASYANFYISNRAVLVPVFGRPNDKRALRILRGLFPGRKVIGIECTALVHGLGAIHCVTQQQPR